MRERLFHVLVQFDSVEMHGRVLVADEVTQEAIDAHTFYNAASLTRNNPARNRVN